MPYTQVQWTTNSLEEAKAISKSLIEKKLVACANIFPIESLYQWEGSLQEDKEFKVLFKTLDEHFSPILDYILEHASYDVPEVSKVPILEANPAYANWVEECVKNE